MEPAADEKARDCWAVAFGGSYNDSERLVVAGYETGDLKFFDLRLNRLMFETNLKSGIVSVEFDRKDIALNKLLVTTLESRFRVFDLKTSHPESGYAYLVEKAHKSTVWLGKHLPQNRYAPRLTAPPPHRPILFSPNQSAHSRPRHKQ